MKKTHKIIYWIVTIWLSLGMLSSGIIQLFKIETDSVTHLGYPIYLLTLLGVWKLLGVIAILVPKFSLIKEWAYAGFFFVSTGALFSHIASGDQISEIFPAILLSVLTILSWYFRPESRKLVNS